MEQAISSFSLAALYRKSLALLVPLLLLNSPAWSQDLIDIYNLAVNNDPQVRQARAEFNATHTTVAQGRSQLLPRLTLNANTARETSGPADAYIDNQGRFQPAHSFANSYNNKGYGLSIQQNLLNFEAWYSYQSILLSDQAAATSLRRAEQDLIMRVAMAYFDVLRSRDNLEAFQAEVAASERILQQTTERFEVGLVAITDVHESQAAYDLARASLLVEQNVLNQRYEALEAITGRSHRNVAILSEDFPIEPVSPDSIDEWVALTGEHNLEILAARLNYEARQEDARAARAALYPTVSLSAGYNWSETGTAFSFIPGASERTNITLNFSMPIFTGGLNNARKRQAYYNRDASEEALLRTERASTQAIRNSYRSVESDVLTIAARRQAIVSARSQLEATEAGAEAGTRNIVDVVIAQRQLFQAQRDYAGARYNYVINTLNLKQAAGLLSPQDVLDLNNWLEQ